MIPRYRWPLRLCAGLVAAAAAAGLVAQYVGELRHEGSGMVHLWTMFRYFTNITGTLAALVFGRIALNAAPVRHTFLLPGTVFAAILVGIVNAVLLGDLAHPGFAARLADILLHDVVPVGAPTFWLAFAEKGTLRYRDPWLWAILPVAYLAYALARGTVEGVYPYPFIDVAAIGWARTALNALGIAGAFLLLGCVVVLLDRRFARRD